MDKVIIRSDVTCRTCDFTVCGCTNKANICLLLKNLNRYQDITQNSLSGTNGTIHEDCPLNTGITFVKEYNEQIYIKK